MGKELPANVLGHRARFAPRDAGFENPIRVSQRRAENQPVGLGRFSGGNERAGKR